jgi:hypothetical protein
MLCLCCLSMDHLSRANTAVGVSPETFLLLLLQHGQPAVHLPVAHALNEPGLSDAALA